MMFDVNALYNDDDASRYNNKPRRSKRDLARLTEGPGDYLLRVDAVRYGQSSKTGKTYFAADLEVLATSPNSGEVTHEVGEMVSHVVIIDSKWGAREALEMAAAVLGLPPIVKIPTGVMEPYGGRVLPIADLSDLEDMSQGGGEQVKGQELWAECYNHTKTRGRHKGKTFTNVRFAPPCEEGEGKGRWKQFEDFEPATLRAIANKRWG